MSLLCVPTLHLTRNIQIILKADAELNEDFFIIIILLRNTKKVNRKVQKEPQAEAAAREKVTQINVCIAN